MGGKGHCEHNWNGVMRKESGLRPGDKLGQLEVIELKHDLKSGRIRLVAKCKCDCGKLTSPLAQDVLSGKTKSCGCNGSSIQRLLARHHGEIIPDLTDSNQKIGNMRIVLAWHTGTGNNVKMRKRGQIWVALECPGCLEHVAWEIGAAERRKPKSCGCQGGYAYVTIEKKAERQRSYRQADFELRTEMQNIQMLTGKGGTFKTRMKKDTSGATTE